MKKVIDTNIILNFPEIILKERCVLTSIVVSELEHIKTSGTKSEEVKYQARKAVRMLNDNADAFDIHIVTNDTYKIVEEHNLPVTNDNLIIASCVEIDDAEFISNDLVARLIAQNIFGIKSEGYSHNAKEHYKGYVKISGNSDYINSYIENIDYSEWFANEYLIVENSDDGKSTEMRYNGQSFVPLKLPPSSYIKAKNALQRCALDLLLNKDISTVAILGGYGSGKTMLSTQMALYHVLEKGNQAKILGIRECSGEGKEVGFLKGTFEDKTGKFFKPIEQQLKGGEFELESLINRGVLETNIPFYLKGTTYNDTVMIVDEAEDLTESQIKLIGTRLGGNSKVYFAGDYAQSLINKTKNNALVKMCEALKGNPMFGCIVLDEDVRSETSRVFANLFKE